MWVFSLSVNAILVTPRMFIVGLAGIPCKPTPPLSQIKPPIPHRAEGLVLVVECLQALLLNTKSMHIQAEPHIRRALKLDEARYGPDNPHVAIRLNNLVSLLQDTNRLAEAEPLMRRALQINEANFGPDHPSVALCLNNLASLLKITYRLIEAAVKKGGP